MLNHSNQLTNQIDSYGNLLISPAACKPIIEQCETLAKSMLGCTLHVRGRRFIIRMLEIYYGGLADNGHDWYRTRFTYKTSKYKDHTEIQAWEGFRVYISSFIADDTYARFDIVVGPAGVPVSFLVRSLWDEDFNLIGTQKGSPNIVLRALGLQPTDHGVKIGLGKETADSIFLEDTHAQVLKERNLSIKQTRRINLKSTFEAEHGVEWNFYLE